MGWNYSPPVTSATERAELMADPEIAGRVTRFQEQRQAWEALGRVGVPVFSLDPKGFCFSCGSPIDGSSSIRCQRCITAINLVLGQGFSR